MAELQKSMGFVPIVALTIVSLMGSSLYFGVSLAAGISRVASLVAWSIIAVVALYVSACFGELISMFPAAGGVYEFAKQTYGRFASFIIGWGTWIVGNITTALMIVAAIDYAIPGTENNEIKLLITIGIILVLNAITFFGVEASSKILVLFAIITVGMVIAIVFPGLLGIEQANYTGIIPQDWTLVLLTVFYIVEAFFGWESASFMAEEVKNAAKVIPRALMVATITSIVLGFLIAFVQMGVLGVDNLIQSGASFLDIAFIIYGPIGAKIINIAIIITLIGAAAGGIVSTPRLLLALGRDKLFIEQFSHINKKFKTPDRAIILQTVIAIVFVLISFGKYREMLSYLVPLALLMYITVLMSVTILRFKRKDIVRTFKAPLGKFLPVVVAIFYGTIIVIWVVKEASGLHNLKVLGSFMLFAIPIYLLLTVYYHPRAIIGFTNSAAHFNYWFEDFLFPKHIRKKMLTLFHNLKESTVLELGSGVGTLTMHLADSVGPTGKVIAIDLSQRNLNIIEKRVKKKEYKHVQLVHDEHMINRVHPEVKSADVVFSVGHLSYIQDLSKVLKEIYEILPDAGKICFVEYLYYFLPNKAILSDRKALSKIFREAGFSVNITMHRSLFWKFVFVYGIKSGDEEVPIV
ncbi:MAG: amino acid permease [Nanoarchaeota archaeon]|nr:amino acid permease [Nanoarchaeota archaeon]